MLGLVFSVLIALVVIAFGLAASLKAFLAAGDALRYAARFSSALHYFGNTISGVSNKPVPSTNDRRL